MSDLIVPGKWICDKCSFVLLKKVLSVSSGAVGTDYNPKPDPCPNDGTTMRAYSWKEEAQSMLPSMKRLEEMFFEKCDELDALKKKDQIPDGFAVIHEKEGYFVGCWRGREVAEKIVARSPSAKGEVIKAIRFID